MALHFTRRIFVTSSRKKLATHNKRNLIGAHNTADKKAARKWKETGASSNSIDGVDLIDGDGATGGIHSKHRSPQQAPVQPRAPPFRMLRFADVTECTGLSRTTIWRRVRAGTFPAPLSLGENSFGWPENLIQEWIESRPVVHYANQEAATA